MPGARALQRLPEFPLAGVEKEMTLIQLLSGKPVVAIALNHEGLAPRGGADAGGGLPRR